MQPRITVITVCYNAQELIEETIKSIVNQSYKNVEYIVIDGKSKDATMCVVDKYRSKISMVICEPDKGIYFAMNKGLAMATGEYVLFMNAGDIFHNNQVIDVVFSISGVTDEDVIFGDTIYVNSWGKTFGEGKYIEKPTIVMPFSHQSVFVRTDLIKKIGFDTSFKIQADYNQIMQLYKNNASFKHVPVIISDYLCGGFSSNVLQTYRDGARILNLRGWTYFSGLIRAFVKETIIKALPKAMVVEYSYLKRKKEIVKEN